MTTTQTVYPKAEAGRRVLYTRYRDLPQGPEYPGVITSVDPDEPGASLLVRLDGTRSNLFVRPNYEGLRYLDEVGPVPELPMGRFTPVASDTNGFYETAGVLLAVIGEDGEDFVILTGDQDKAREAVTVYAAEIGMDLDFIDFGLLHPYWAVFEWEPEDAECPWTVRWDASESDDQAVHIFHLPA
jgi:hypothetical protein